MHNLLDESDVFVRQLWGHPLELAAVVVSAIVMYLAFWLLVRLFGPRTLRGMSTFDTVLVVMFGAVAGRVILGNIPTLAGGVVGLATLFVLEAVFGQIRQTARGLRVLNARPMVLMAGEKLLHGAMHRMHITEHELNYALRRAGISHRNQVACVVCEPNGELSVLRRGTLIDRALLLNIANAEEIPEELLAGTDGGSQVSR